MPMDYNYIVDTSMLPFLIYNFYVVSINLIGELPWQWDTKVAHS